MPKTLKAHPLIVFSAILAAGVYIGYKEAPTIQTTGSYLGGMVDGAIALGLAVLIFV